VIAGDILGERTRLTPEKLALVYVPTGKRFTYRQLNGRALGCAAMWQRIGLRKGDRIGILAHNCVEFVDAFFAAGKSGVILVPLNTRLTPHELEYIIRDSGMRALMYEDEFGEVIGKLKERVQVERWIVLGGTSKEGDVVYNPNRLRGAKEGAPSDLPSPKEGEGGALTVAIGPEDIYCLLYTSGTTGKPKGVMIPHRQIVWNAYNTVMSWQLRDTDISPIFTPMYHAGGLNVFLTPLFAVGGTVVLHHGFDAAEIWHIIEQEHCTVVMGVPTVYKLLADAPEFAGADLKSVRWLISGGAPLPLYIQQAYAERGVTFKQGYGLTEVGVNCFAMTPEDSVRKPGSIGKPMMFTEVRLADAEGNEVATGEVGELWLRGPHVSRGYWNQPEATAAALDKDSWFHTGDQARRDGDGFYYIAGRSKDMFISGGVNVCPAEIEAELLLHPEVHDAAVIGVPHELWGETGVAFVVAETPKTITAGDLQSFLADRLSKFKIPKEFVFVSELPRTPYGKVIKSQLRDEYLRPL
jgi:fatty-acyl-CoA synthase